MAQSHCYLANIQTIIHSVIFHLKPQDIIYAELEDVPMYRLPQTEEFTYSELKKKKNQTATAT